MKPKRKAKPTWGRVTLSVTETAEVVIRQEHGPKWIETRVPYRVALYALMDLMVYQRGELTDTLTAHGGWPDDAKS